MAAEDIRDEINQEIIMSIGHNLQKIGLVIILIIVLILSWNSCQDQRSKISDLESKGSADSLNFITMEDRSVLQEEVIIKQKKTFKELVEKVNGVTKENRQLKATVRTEVLALPVASIGGAPDVITLPAVHDTVQMPGRFLRLPMSYGFEDNWRGIYFSIDTAGESMVDRMWFVNKPLITFGYQERKGLDRIFGKRIPVVSYLDKNPYSQVKSIQNISFDPKKKWYQRKGLFFGLGFVGGLFTINQLSK